MTLILVHSPKGGVGTTFIAAQLALQLAKHAPEVVAVDCTDQEALKLHFGLRPAQSLAGLGDEFSPPLVASGVTLKNGYALSRQSVVRAEPDGIDATLFPGGSVTIVDVSAGDRELKDRLMPFATLHLCVLTPTPAALAVLPAIEPGTPTVALAKTAFILNQIDDRLRLSRHSCTFFRQLFGDLLIGSIRRDEAVNEALGMFEPIARLAPSSVVMTDLADLAAAVEVRCGLATAAEPAGAAL